MYLMCLYCYDCDHKFTVDFVFCRELTATLSIFGREKMYSLNNHKALYMYTHLHYISFNHSFYRRSDEK